MAAAKWPARIEPNALDHSTHNERQHPSTSTQSLIGNGKAIALSVAPAVGGVVCRKYRR
jgi:hypothetical protein